MREADTEFVQAALAAIRQLGSLVVEHRRGNARLDFFVQDLHAVFLRYLKSGHCLHCDSKVQLPPIVHDVFCDPECEARDENRKFDSARSLEEALAQYTPAEDAQ